MRGNNGSGDDTAGESALKVAIRLINHDAD
jgi:hypothetical protein